MRRSGSCHSSAAGLIERVVEFALAFVLLVAAQQCFKTDQEAPRLPRLGVTRHGHCTGGVQRPRLSGARPQGTLQLLTHLPPCNVRLLLPRPDPCAASLHAAPPPVPHPVTFPSHRQPRYSRSAPPPSPPPPPLSLSLSLSLSLPPCLPLPPLRPTPIARKCPPTSPGGLPACAVPTVDTRRRDWTAGAEAQPAH